MLKRLQVGEGFSLPSWGTNLEMVETLCAQKEMVGYLDLEQLQLAEKMVRAVAKLGYLGYLEISASKKKTPLREVSA